MFKKHSTGDESGDVGWERQNCKQFTKLQASSNHFLSCHQSHWFPHRAGCSLERNRQCRLGILVLLCFTTALCFCNKSCLYNSSQVMPCCWLLALPSRPPALAQPHSHRAVTAPRSKLLLLDIVPVARSGSFLNKIIKGGSSFQSCVSTF